MKHLYLATGILTASIASALATTTPVPSTPAPSFQNTPVALRNNTPLARPDGASNRILTTGADIAVDRINGAGTSAGVRTHKPVIIPSQGPIYSIFTEYNYIDTLDSRALGSDLQTHSVTLGGSALFNGNTLLGVNYSYSNGSSDVSSTGISSNSDSHFVSLVAAKSFWQFLTVGVAGAYGNTDFTIRSATAGRRTSASMDTWSVSPFVSASYKTGRLTTSLTAMYQFEDDRTTTATTKINDDTTKFSLALRGSYAVSEQLKLQVSAKWNQMLTGLNQTVGLPEARTWATFGGRVSYNVNRMLELYAGYSYDAFNNHLQSHTATAGVRYTF